MGGYPHPNLPPRRGGRLPGNTARARYLRRNMTKAEQVLWRHLRMKQMAGWRFRRQSPVGPYVADFLCLDPPLIIELDGGQHDRRKPHDEKRTAFLNAKGFRVLRFWNNEVLTNIGGVLTVIREEGFALLESPPPLAGEDLGGGEA
ncbi:endonuclease domain-containing protein [Parvibaculum sp.]|uniref:endonuclease domain-containing protein n=1 Tax=Parvibaculum sp. TaxID=2024848 RepID=UPI0025DA6B91|nr:endonuclease domain-containing protein [Parvibaculum sp.]